jgi:hypothetical protein
MAASQRVSAPRLFLVKGRDRTLFVYISFFNRFCYCFRLFLLRILFLDLDHPPCLLALTSRYVADTYVRPFADDQAAVTAALGDSG